MRHAVILAGGSGTRLWPASRRAHPKQFVAFGGEPLLALAIRRAARIADGRVTIVTAAAQVHATEAVISELDTQARVEVIAEPMGRNTAAAIGLAAATILRYDPDAVIGVLPADQQIADEQTFAAIARAAFAEVEVSDSIATLGIVPTHPETGFGYLEVAATTPGVVTPVIRFVEKPDRTTAEGYVASGRYLWNAGMFFVSAKRLLAELATHLPETARGVTAIAAGIARAADVYAALPAVSIDHGVMEKAERVVTIPAAVGWDDIGSWAAVAALGPADAQGNVAIGPTPPVILAGDRNFVSTDDDTVIVAYGVSDLVIVKSGNAIFVIPRSEAQHVREVVDALERRGLKKYL